MHYHLENVIDPSGGSNQTRVRAYNERLVLSLIRRHGALAKFEIARRSGLSAQTVGVIMRSLEQDGLLIRGAPVRGKVGQPSIPMSLDPEGVYSIGLKIGRRTADLILVDFLGRQQQTLSVTYPYPTPSELIDFAAKGVKKLIAHLPKSHQNRIAGIGVAMPFELWNWAEKVGAPQSQMDAWRGFDFQSELAEVCDLPIFIQNDATAACGAELIFGRGAELSDFVYFFVGAFIGGGIVLNHTVYSGRTGNAAAMGPMPVIGADGKRSQLLEYASVYSLEQILKKQGLDASALWLEPGDWSQFEDHLDGWINTTASYLAAAIVSACAVIDFEAAIIDGGFPADIRARLVAAIVKEMEVLDLQGIQPPELLEGSVGRKARALGGAGLPLYSRYLLDQNVLFKELA